MTFSAPLPGSPRRTWTRSPGMILCPATVLLNLTCKEFLGGVGRRCLLEVQIPSSHCPPHLRFYFSGDSSWGWGFHRALRSPARQGVRRPHRDTQPREEGARTSIPLFHCLGHWSPALGKNAWGWLLKVFWTVCPCQSLWFKGGIYKSICYISSVWDYGNTFSLLL